jgi:hypothetical protein
VLRELPSAATVVVSGGPCGRVRFGRCVGRRLRGCNSGDGGGELRRRLETAGRGSLASAAKLVGRLGNVRASLTGGDVGAAPGRFFFFAGDCTAATSVTAEEQEMTRRCGGDGGEVGRPGLLFLLSLILLLCVLFVVLVASLSCFPIFLFFPLPLALAVCVCI